MIAPGTLCEITMIGHSGRTHYLDEGLLGLIGRFCMAVSVEIAPRRCMSCGNRRYWLIDIVLGEDEVYVCENVLRPIVPPGNVEELREREEMPA
jgi:hypothetical protein